MSKKIKEIRSFCQYIYLEGVIMAGISNEEVNKIRQSVNIVDVISNYVNLESKGKNYFGVCPFHDDHSPSMSVSPEKQIFNCFVCGVSGNVFSFLQNYKNISFLEAVKEVAYFAGISVNIESNQKVIHEKEYKLMDIVNKYYINNLKSSKGKEALNYLYDRGLSDQVIKEFEIGLALKDGASLSNFLINKKYKEDILIELGISNKNDNIYDVFRNRITFPIHDPNGKVVAFSARIYNSESESKYMNNKESIIFKKGEVLFNYHRAFREAKKFKYLLVVEGQMDAIRIYSNGLKSVVATMGTALTKEQIQLIKRVGVPIRLLMDNDNAGELASISNGDALKKAGLDVSVVRLNGAKDPDEYILKFGIDKFRDTIDNADSYFNFKLKYFKKNKNLNNADEITEYINQVINELNKSNDEVLIDVTLNQLSEEFKIDKDILKKKIKKVEKVKDVPIVKKSIVKKKKYDRICEEMLYYMLSDVYYIKAFQSDLNYIPDDKYYSLAKDILAYYLMYKNLEIADFLTYIGNDEEKYKRVSEIINNHTNQINDDDWNNYIDFVKHWINEVKIKELKEKLKNETDINEKLRINDKITKLKKGCEKNGSK